MAGAESFTVLAILEARDAASEILAKVDESLGKFSETAKTAAETARGAGDSIDESLLKTASGADALDVATARVQASQEKATRTAEAQADAERNLLEAHKAAAAAEDDDVAAQYRLMEANQALTATSKENAAAQKDLAAAQKTAAAADTEAVGAARAQAAAQDKAAGNSAALAAGLGKVGKVAGITALGLGVVAAVSVKAAGNFQSLTAHLVTDAGESAKNLQTVRAGILGISTATGTSATDVTNAMYHIESAGLHGAEGLKVAQVAAEGAKVGGANLDTVSKTLVGTLDAYYGSTMSASNATQRSTSMMEEMVATVGSGDMRMQDLASSLSNVAPLAAAAGISFAQVGGAIATMTAQGMTAQRATQNLNNVIRNIVKPSNVASNEMRALGINALQVEHDVGKQGLTGTLNEYTRAILANSKNGQVTLGYMKLMSPAAQSLAQGILSGSISTGALTQAVKGLNPEQAALLQKFKTAATSATGLKQSYAGAMAALTGGATGLNVAMMLTGKNAKVFSGDVANIARQGKGAATMTQSWAVIQGTFNQKVDVAKTAVENAGIAIGSALLPAVTSLFSAIGKVLVPVAEWTAKHQKLTEILFVGATAVAAVIAVMVIAGKTIKAVSSAATELGKAYKGAVTVIQKLGGASRQTADQQEADAKKTAAAQEKASAESAAAAETAAGEQEAASGEAAAAAEADAAETATANETAAATTSGSWLTAAASTVAGWAAAGARMVAQAAIWVVSNTAKVAVVVAENIAGALVTAGAWMAANLVMTAGIGLVIIAVIAAVALIVKNWSKIVDGVKTAWNAVYDFISKIISDVISFVKSHWVLIVSIITGPLGLAVIEIVKHWNQIKSFVTTVVNDVINFVKQHWRLIVSILGGPLVAAVVLVTKYWSDIKHWFNEGVSTVLGILRGLAHDVVSIGENVVRGIWNGISGMGGWLWGQVKNFASNTLHSFESALGIGSPSKYTTVHGQMLGLGLANGLIASIPKVAAAARLMAGTALSATSGLSARGGSSVTGSSLALSATAAAGGAGGGMTVTIDLRGATVASDASINQLAAKVGNSIVKQLAQAGYKSRLT